MQPQIAPATSPDDRRHPRIALEARITMASQSNFWTGLTENLSEGGVFVCAVDPPAVGELVPVHIQTADDRAMLVWGEVRWHREDSDGNVTGCGIQFLNVDDRARETLQEMMHGTGREPLFMEF